MSAIFKFTCTCKAMASKTITIREEVYEKLSRLKEDKSFSELLEDLVEDRDVGREKSFGSWKGSKDELKRNIREGRKKFDEDFEERL